MLKMQFNSEILLCMQESKQQKIKNKQAHTNTRIYSGSVYLTPTSTTQPQLRFLLYSLRIQFVRFYKITIPTCCFEDHNEPLHMWFYKITTSTYCSSRITTNLYTVWFYKITIPTCCFSDHNEPPSTICWVPTFLKVEIELTNSKKKNPK